MISLYIQFAHFFLIGTGFLGVILFCAIMFFTNKMKVAKIVTIIYAIIAIIVGVVYIPKWAHAYEASLTECEKNGHRYVTEEYHNILNTTIEIENVDTDTHYEGTLEGNLTGTGNGFIFIYHSTVSATVNGELTQIEEYKYYYKTSDGGYKKASVPVENATIYYISEGEQPYIEVWTQYGNWTGCEVCGENEHEWEVSFYKFYVPEGSISKEFNID